MSLMASHAVEWGEGTVTVRVRKNGPGPAVLLAHGAGTDQDHGLMVGLAERLASHDLSVVTFNYPYTEAGRRGPDRPARLLACHRGVAAWSRREVAPDLVFGGRSMGGRMSTMLAAEGEPMAGVVAYAYPLHPGGKPDRLRIEHLVRIPVPMLFFQGDRDALARPDLFDRHVRSLPGVEVVDLVGVDHSWRARGRSLDQLLDVVVDSTSAWIRHLATSG